jgi:hypothetical protein
MRNLILTGLAAMILAGCSGCQLMPNDTPEGRLYNATATYGGTVKLSLIYESLPRCTQTLARSEAARSLCSQTDAVTSIREADNAAFNALTIFGAGIPSNPGIDALRAAIDLDRARLHSDTN